MNILNILIPISNDDNIIEFLKKEDENGNNIFHLITYKDDYVFFKEIQKYTGNILLNEEKNSNYDYISYLLRKKIIIKLHYY